MTETTEATFAFVLMPFGADSDDVYRLGIKEPADALDIRAERVDEQMFTEGILDRIYRQIDVADIVIADMSGKNPNVFYEVGYAHAKDKLCLLLTNDVADIPFDLKHKRHIVYRSIQDLRKQLTTELRWAQDRIGSVRRSRLRVTPKTIDGHLEKNSWSATAKMSFGIDLHNDSNVPSAAIESVYFYVGQDWTVRQDDKVCPSTESDLPPYNHRHFLVSPVKRLQPTGWAQLRFTAERVLARSWSGQELKDSYLIAGRSTLRFITDKGIFDHEILINTIVDEFPF